MTTKNEAWIVSIDEKGKVILLGRTDNQAIVQNVYEYTHASRWNKGWAHCSPTLVTVPDYLGTTK